MPGIDMAGISMAGWLLIVAVLVDLIVRVVAIIVVPRNRRPATAVAWLMAIFLIPYIGVLVFLLIGSYKLPKKRRDKQQAINQFILETTEGIDLVTKNHAWPPWLESVVELNRNLGAMPLVGGNNASLIGDYAKSIEAMALDVAKARRYVHVEFYIMSYDSASKEFFDALGRPSSAA